MILHRVQTSLCTLLPCRLLRQSAPLPLWRAGVPPLEHKLSTGRKVCSPKEEHPSKSSYIGRLRPTASTHSSKRVVSDNNAVATELVATASLLIGASTTPLPANPQKRSDSITWSQRIRPLRGRSRPDHPPSRRRPPHGDRAKKTYPSSHRRAYNARSSRPSS